MRWLMLLFGVSYLVALAAGYAHLFNLDAAVGLHPPSVRGGQVWRVITYGLVPAGLLDWLFGLLWFSVLGGQLGRLWSSRTFWLYCLIALVGSAAAILLFLPQVPVPIVGSAPITFGLLAAWYRLCGFEPLILHGLGRVTVRQAALVIAGLNVAIVFVSCGWQITLCLMTGGLVVAIALSIHRRWNLLRLQHATGSSRIHRLEV